jgi:rhamnose utilization protein RhaD (predicted bifunctional aldolase and dehydrogenase)/NAD(P)-dependent dehydrogenase (short-subunit alcohol dehydrogenase family)
VRSRWSDAEAEAAVARWGAAGAEDLALRIYTSRLLGADPALVLHGGGNTSLKGSRENVLGEKIAALFVKASGHDLASIGPEGLPALDLAWLRNLRAVESLSDRAMVNELRTHLLDARAATPSIETLVHAWIRGRYVDHTHADAILVLTNQEDGEARVREALGGGVAVVPYVKAGFELARVVAAALEAQPTAHALVLLQHGVITWGETARESYERMIEVVDAAERYADAHSARRVRAASPTPLDRARERVARVAPVLRGLLAAPTGDPDQPFQRQIVVPLVEPEVLALVEGTGARELLCSGPLTSDHLIRTKALPAWVEAPAWEDEPRLRKQLADAIDEYVRDYEGYVERHRALLPDGVAPADPRPRVVLLPGLGALCAGPDAYEADVARDITRQTLAAKERVAAMGARYRALPERDLFEMEYFTLQQAKLPTERPRLGGHVALVTGAAGAIGSGIARALLAEGCHVALTDLPGERLGSLAAELAPRFGPRVAAVPLDVADPASVAEGFAATCRIWGGVDLVVVNAGLAHVASLAELSLEDFRRLERVNVEGTLLVLGEASRLFARQGTGGDVVLVSTKNVFAPGASFGAYSATKAAAHQLARIASLELAPLGVRVNMVAPDAVFGEPGRRSGLWKDVGPDRMRARGLDERGLEDYYRDRNLLKARVTPEHVARAVLFFATRQTPTTGATLPVDGGLPESTPR